MKLTDQEQVVLKAIRHVGRSGLAPIASVVKAVGYPKDTTKKILIGLSSKRVVTLHRHDYPGSLSPADRKLLIRQKDNSGRYHYYNAVSIRERNPKGKHLPGATAKQQRQYEAIKRSELKRGEDVKTAKRIAAATVRKRAKKNKTQGKGKQALKTTGRALKKAASSVLGAGAQILGAGSKALNPKKRIKVRNRYVDLVIKGQAKKTPQGWQVGRKTFTQGRGTVSVSSGYYLDRHTGMVYAKRERNKTRRRNVEMGFYDASGFHPIRASSDYSEGQRPSRSKRAKSTKRKAVATASHKRKVSSRKKTTGRLASRAIKKTVKSRKRRNISEGFYDASGTFHPIRTATDYSPAIAGETGRQAKHTKSKKRLAAKRKASATARHRSLVAGRKKTTARLAGRSIKKSAGALRRRGRKNPSPESIRKQFAGRVSGSRDLYFPQGTPQGLAKLGKLVLIQTEEGTIKPVHGSAWLCADTHGKLHIGSTTNAPLFDGPKKNFGKVSKIEYDESKPHLGYPGPIIWFHKLGEETGQRPTLQADGHGGLVFKGGAYRITSRGIEN